MWRLVNDKGDIFHLPVGKLVSVSRKVGDLILSGDQSVSREHAFLMSKSPIEDGILLWDSKSKFGTYVNEGIASSTKIGPSEKVTLRNGDRIRFGLQHNIWTLQHSELCVCSSNLNADEKSFLATLIPKVNGKFQDRWTEQCSFLTIKAISLTVKVVCALACGKPIVTPAFWQCYKDALNSTTTKVPDVEDFIPPFKDVINRKKELFLPKASRKLLFKDKVFVFPSAEHLHKYGCMVQFAGGKAVVCSANKAVEEYCKPNVIVMQHEGPEAEMSCIYQEVLNKLRCVKLRAIPVRDIGFAILDGSLNVFCNPSENPHDLLCEVGKLKSDSVSATVVAPSTEEGPTSSLDQTSKFSENFVIPPTCSTTKSMQSEETPVVPHRSAVKRQASNKHQSVDESLWNSGSTTMESSFFGSNSREGRDKLHSTLSQAENKSFSFNLGKPSSPTTNLNGKSDDFFIPSPKSKKRKKLTDCKENDDGDLFDLPARPISLGKVTSASIEDDDGFNFDASIPKQREQRVRQVNDSVTSNVDLFDESSDDLFGSAKPNLKRKVEYEDQGMIDPTPMKQPRHQSSNFQSPFLSKDNPPPQVKQEVACNNIDSTTAELSEKLRDKMVVETVSLITRPGRAQSDNGLACSKAPHRNFKKFVKLWKPPATRAIVTGFMQKENLLDGPQEESEELNEEEFDVSKRPRNGLRAAHQHKDEPDEWSFRLSQV